MRNSLRSSLIALAMSMTPALVLALGQDAQPKAPSLAGHWEGTIAMNTEVRFTADIEKNPQGVWIGALTITGASAVDVPLDAIVAESGTATFHAGLLESPTFKGAFSADGSELQGDVANARGAVPFKMKRSTAVAHVNTPAPSTPMAQAKDIEGVWTGALTADGATMRISLTITAAPDGTAAATLVNLDQGSTSVPITTLTYRDKELRLESRAVSGRYVGKLGSDGALVGQWTQGPQTLPLSFKRPS